MCEVMGYVLVVRCDVIDNFFLIEGGKRRLLCFFFFKQKTAYEMRISDWSSDVCSSDLNDEGRRLTPVDLRSGFDKLFELLELGYQDVQAFALENEGQFGPAAKRHEQHRLILRRLPGLHPDRAEQLRFAVRPVALFEFGDQRACQDRVTFGAYIKAVKRPNLLPHGEAKIGRAHVGTPVTK